jgi:hypothetical protein
VAASQAVLLDKIYKFDRHTTYELGGEAAVRVLHDAGVDAVHTTCYEQKSKVMGLKVCFTVCYMCTVIGVLWKCVSYICVVSVGWFD